MADILQLKDFDLFRMEVEWCPPDEDETVAKAEPEEEASLPPRISYEVMRRVDAPQSFALRLECKTPPGGKCLAGSYKIHAVIAGFMEFPEDMSEDQMQYLIRVNGGTILYGILRGQIAAFTGSFPGGKFVLPAVDMKAVVESVEAKRRKSTRLTREAMKAQGEGNHLTSKQVKKKK